MRLLTGYHQHPWTRAALIDDLKLRTLIGSISPLDHPTVSLWDYLKEELTAADFESTQELKRERVANFLSVPIAFEKACSTAYLLSLQEASMELGAMCILILNCFVSHR
jgi:hypothetical protein